MHLYLRPIEPLATFISGKPATLRVLQDEVKWTSVTEDEARIFQRQSKSENSSLKQTDLHTLHVTSGRIISGASEEDTEHWQPSEVDSKSLNEKTQAE